MSVERIESLVAGFPANLRDPVVGYARSIKAAIPDIRREVSVEPDQRLEDEVVFIAGIRKLYAIVASTFWTLHKALTNLHQRNIPSVRIAGHHYSFESLEYRQLNSLYDSLRALLEQENLFRFMRRMNYATVLKTLVDERREHH